MDEDDAAAVVGSEEAALSFYQFGFLIIFGSFSWFFVIFWVFFCWLVQDPHKAIIKCK